MLDEFKRAKARAIERLKEYLKERGQGNKEANRRKVETDVTMAEFTATQTDAQPAIQVPADQGGNACVWTMTFTDAGSRDWQLMIDVDTTLEESVQDAHVGFEIKSDAFKKLSSERRLGHVWINKAPVWRK